MLCTKLDPECDRQATVVRRLLTTLGDDRRAVAKLLISEVGEKLQRELRLCLEITEFRICLMIIRLVHYEDMKGNAKCRIWGWFGGYRQYHYSIERLRLPIRL